MNLKLKVCGMKDANNILEVAALHPDYMGFIFYATTPRFVGDDFQLPNDFPATIKKVGVFVNASTGEMLAKARTYRLDFLQLHGEEPVSQVEELSNQGIKVIKVFSVDDSFDFNKTKEYAGLVDYFLFDTKGSKYGGNARTFDWSVLTRYDQEVPFFLSGGLSSENIEQTDLLNKMNLYALDLNSGVEASPGIKSVEKIQQVMSSLKNLKSKFSNLKSLL